VDVVAEIKEALKEQGRATVRALEAGRRPTIQLSDIDSDGWQSTIVASGFQVDATTSWPTALSDLLGATAGENPPAFQWDDRNEPDQEDRYLPHLNSHLHMKGDVALRALNASRTFLNVSDKRLKFDIKGTSDVAVLHQGYISAHLEGQGILGLIELKKECNQKGIRQTIGQLIAADLLSHFSPLAVLTDLRDEWHFFWLEGRTIKHLQPPKSAEGRRMAFLFLSLVLGPGFLVGEKQSSAEAAVNALPVSVAKRRKLSPVKEDRTRRDSEDEEGAQVKFSSESDSEEDDNRQLLFRQVRQMIRLTPWLQEVCRPSSFKPMSEEACGMFG